MFLPESQFVSLIVSQENHSNSNAQMHTQILRLLNSRFALEHRYSGAIVEMPGKFDSDHVWKRFQSDELSLFMAVPTVYSKLISHWEEKFDTKEQEDATEAASRLRLMVSGSAALPNSVFKRWQHVGGHTLLESFNN